MARLKAHERDDLKALVATARQVSTRVDKAEAEVAAARAARRTVVYELLDKGVSIADVAGIFGRSKSAIGTIALEWSASRAKVAS